MSTLSLTSPLFVIVWSRSMDLPACRYPVWDGLILRYHSGNPQPFASDAVPTPPVIDLEAAVLSWADETLQVLNRAETRYRDPPRLQTLERSYLEDNGPAVRLQLRRAAGRLAALLDWALLPTED